jgi:hypothetical protein
VEEEKTSIMPKTINEYFQPSSTSSHSNIDNLILQAELDKFAQTGSMREDRTPRYIGGTDDVVANIALSPILTLKSMGNVGRKILEKTGLRNPVSHYTRGQSAKDILESGTIKGSEGGFPGKPFYRDSRKYLDRQLERDKTGWLSETDIKFQEQFPKSPAVSITRDPMFTSRPHKSIGTDIRFVLDRDEMVKKGLKMQPYVEEGFQKIKQSYGAKNFGNLVEGLKSIELGMPTKKLYKTSTRANPKFEFEDRVRGNIPTENIKLIDILQLPLGESNLSDNMLKLLSQLSKAKQKGIPIIKSNLVKERLGKLPMYIDYRKQPTEQLLKFIKNKTAKELKGLTIPNPSTDDILQLLQTPTYKFDPFEKVR